MEVSYYKEGGEQVFPFLTAKYIHVEGGGYNCSFYDWCVKNSREDQIHLKKQGDCLYIYFDKEILPEFRHVIWLRNRVQVRFKHRKINLIQKDDTICIYDSGYSKW